MTRFALDSSLDSSASSSPPPASCPTPAPSPHVENHTMEEMNLEDSIIPTESSDSFVFTPPAPRPPKDKKPPHHENTSDMKDTMLDQIQQDLDSAVAEYQQQVGTLFQAFSQYAAELEAVKKEWLPVCEAERIERQRLDVLESEVNGATANVLQK